MKIDFVKITNFRSLKETVKINLPQICALVGPNNAGKSNILNAINKVLGKDWVTVNNFGEEDVYLSEHDRNIEIEIQFTEPYMYEAFKGTTSTAIDKVKFSYTRYKVGEFKGQRRLEKKCLTKDDKEVSVLSEKPKLGTPRKYKPLSTIPQEMQESIPVIFLGTDRSLKNQLPGSRNSLLATLLQDINRDFEDFKNTVQGKKADGTLVDVSRLHRFNQCISEAIKVLRTEQFIELENSIRDNALHQLGFDIEKDRDKLNIYFNPLSSLEFYKSLEIWVNENNFKVNATELGAGFQNAIVISILKAFEERRKNGAIFLIEEPEMFLHPQMQRSLYKTIRKIGATNQVIYITHSANFVTVPEFDEIRIVRKSESGTAVKQSTLKPDPKLKEKFRKELDPERNELFFAQRILIVEGDTEKLAFPEYAKRLGIDFDKVGSTIVEVGGKRNIIDFVELAISFEIPVAVVYDTDSSDFQGKRNDEVEYNATLEKYKEAGVTVFNFNKNYEEELKKSWSEKKYVEYCQKYEKTSKAIRARLFAIDTEISIPEFVTPIIKWTGNILE